MYKTSRELLRKSNIRRGCEKIVQNGRKPPNSIAVRVIP